MRSTWGSLTKKHSSGLELIRHSEASWLHDLPACCCGAPSFWFHGAVQRPTSRGATAPGPPSKDQAARHINQAYLVRSNRLELKLIWAFFCRVVQTVTRLDVSFGSCSVSCVILCIPPTPLQGRSNVSVVNHNSSVPPPQSVMIYRLPCLRWVRPLSRVKRFRYSSYSCRSANISLTVNYRRKI